METGKMKYFFTGKEGKTKNPPTFSYNVPDESYEKSPVMKLKY